MLEALVQDQMRDAERLLRAPYVARQVRWPDTDDNLIRVVIGPRRAGKSVLALHKVAAVGSFGFVNFDDERLVGIDLDQLLASIDRVCGNPEHLLFEEIQNVPDWPLVVNRLQRQGRKVTLTGSNAHMLSSELATHLTGRHIPIVLFPFSFPEVLTCHDHVPSDNEAAALFSSFINDGGYPEPLLRGVSRKDYLVTLFRSVLYKDVVVRHGIRNVREMETVARLLIDACSQRYAPANLAKAAGNVSVNTVQKYIGYLNEAFVAFSVERFSFKSRLRASGPRKAYFIDNGMVTANSTMFSSNMGPLCENAVACSLRFADMTGRLNMFYWQDDAGHEVDFVVVEDQKVKHLIQVCVDPSNDQVFSREARALLKAGKLLDCDSLLILTGGVEGESDFTWYGDTAHIKMQPIRKWLVENSNR
jgi:uncharacterized protein